MTGKRKGRESVMPLKREFPARCAARLFNVRQLERVRHRTLVSADAALPDSLDSDSRARSDLRLNHDVPHSCADSSSAPGRRRVPTRCRAPPSPQRRRRLRRLRFCRRRRLARRDQPGARTRTLRSRQGLSVLRSGVNAARRTAGGPETAWLGRAWAIAPIHGTTYPCLLLPYYVSKLCLPGYLFISAVYHTSQDDSEASYHRYQIHSIMN